MLVDQVCAQTGKLAFGQLREGVEQHFGDAVIQNRIAYKFETLIVFRVETAVGQRLLQQLDTDELMAQAPLNRLMCLLPD